MLLLGACSFQHGSLSQRDAPAGTPQEAAVDAKGTPDGPRSCPIGFVSLPGAPAGSKYLAFSAHDFPTAVNSCKTAGTHLVQLDTPGEVDAVYTLVDQATTGVGDTHLYRVVGARDTSVIPNRWLDLSGSPLTFLPWGVTEPTNGVGEDCIVVRLETASATMHVIGADQCLTNHEYACECE